MQVKTAAERSGTERQQPDFLCFSADDMGITKAEQKAYDPDNDLSGLNRKTNTPDPYWHRCPVEHFSSGANGDQGKQDCGNAGQHDSTPDTEPCGNCSLHRNECSHNRCRHAQGHEPDTGMSSAHIKMLSFHILFLSFLLFLSEKHKPLRKQAHRDCRENIHHGMLFDKCNGNADHSAPDCNGNPNPLRSTLFP